MNRLSTEKSPYLLMHAQNPVNWFAWGEEAFEAAREQDKPIFLSIGYSSCHWCHVIAHESFEDEDVASVLNAGFISVKVDKEERPDVDAVYMDAVELATGSGGWPMSLLLTPSAVPFFAATYLPKDALLKLLRQAAGLWREDKSGVLESAEAFARAMRDMTSRAPAPQAPSSGLTQRAVRAYAAQYDSKWGGFGQAPKFPSAHNMLFLLDYYERAGDRAALDMAEGTLEAMARGGIFDHIGGGFCRYSVDRKWLVPHFEKMLYDNALLLWAYAKAWRVAKNPLYRAVARRIASYVLDEMTGPEGQFYCAQDADSAGKEGAYYVFSPEELISLLGEADGRRFCDWYGITPKGNFEGKSIPNRIGRDWDEKGEQDIEELRRRVYRYRMERLPLGKDDKVLTSWNALMIAALCAASEALEEPEYLNMARRAEAFIRKHLIGGGARLLLRYREGEAKGAGVLTDYAYYLLALTMLNKAAQDTEYLDAAQRIAGVMLENFVDDKGGLYLYDERSERLITRPRQTWDAAMPSGNSCAALALTLLAGQSGDPRWKKAAEAQLGFVAGAAAENPTAHGFAQLAISNALK